MQKVQEELKIEARREAQEIKKSKCMYNQQEEKTWAKIKN